MNKKIWMIIAIIVMLLIGVGIFFYFKNETLKEEENNYEANRTSATNTSNEEQKNSNDTNPEQENTSFIEESKKNLTGTENTPPPKTEEQIATFTTKIYSTDSARQNNISITCNTLNGTIVKNGETFSFCGTVGQASTNKGYQKADIFDKNGNKKKGLGGRKLPN